MSNNRMETYTIPRGLQELLCCKECGGCRMESKEGDVISCASCKEKYNIVNGVPSMTDEEVVKDQEWNSHDSNSFDKGSDSYYKRATGELPEKESSKSLARLLDSKGIYSPGDSILDVGCAAGHFLKSLRRLLDSNVKYTGIDVIMKYLQWAQDVYGISESSTFVQCDALDMPFKDDSFDIVYINLFHFFPNISEALEESVRVSRDRVLWRTPIGETTYAIKEIFKDDYEDLGNFDINRDDFDYTLYMLYSEKYVRGLADSKGWSIDFIERDDDFEPFDNNENFDEVPATQVVDGKQINGNMVLDWHYISISDR